MCGVESLSLWAREDWVERTGLVGNETRWKKHVKRLQVVRVC